MTVPAVLVPISLLGEGFTERRRKIHQCRVELFMYAMEVLGSFAAVDNEYDPIQQYLNNKPIF